MYLFPLTENGATRLKTEDKNVANKLKVHAEYELIAELMGFKKEKKS